ncbi:hypothetical protein ABT236_35750 [Streptomyces sp. NPDC001523]|uniref:hypothetical protein n=1 Tax=Streptomyces sp. NPDC001523 TaxID=3154383 RepID=UPI003317493A
MDTLTLLSLTTPFLQLIDAEARRSVEDGVKAVLDGGGQFAVGGQGCRRGCTQ